MESGLATFSKAVLIGVLTVLFGGSCSTVKTLFAADQGDTEQKPISNPFGTFYGSRNDPNETMIFRTKKGDRSVEVEMPAGAQEMTDFVVPIAPAFKDSFDRSPASDSSDASMTDNSYLNHAPTIADREITAKLPSTLPEDDAKRAEIEKGLDLIPSESLAGDRDDKSYLAGVDHIKQLYRLNRYEAALIETEGMIHRYQTDPRLYEMRGTLLDRIGNTDLALKSWEQALRFDPKNVTLRKFIEHRQQRRSLASP